MYSNELILSKVGTNVYAYILSIDIGSLKPIFRFSHSPSLFSITLLTLQSRIPIFTPHPFTHFHSLPLVIESGRSQAYQMQENRGSAGGVYTGSENWNISKLRTPVEPLGPCECQR